eukprot:Hpha_TRINITY_DN22876_c0_g1::TRINITY_DN22876_c0_g1_i1::g.84401::m.84401
MGKRAKPKPLEENIQTFDDSVPAIAEYSACVPEAYAAVCSPHEPIETQHGVASGEAGGLCLLPTDEGGDQPVSRAAVPVGENPDGVSEGMLVHLREDIQTIVETSPCCNFVSIMETYVYNGMMGDVKLIESDYCCCVFEGEEHWLPCAACEPLRLGKNEFKAVDGKTNFASEGLVVVLHPDAPDIVAVSPFHWNPQLEDCYLNRKSGTLREIIRGTNAIAQVRFGGFLWSLPLRGLQTDPASPRRRGSLMVAKLPPISLGVVYKSACQELGMKPNSQMIASLATPGLTCLDLSRNYLGPKGVKCLAAVLRVNHSISELVLRGVELTNPCVAIIAEALKKDSHVKRLDLSDNTLSYSAGRKLLWLLQTNTALVEVNLGRTRVQQSLQNEIQTQCAVNAADRLT